jgi:hypothetical protein
LGFSTRLIFSLLICAAVSAPFGLANRDDTPFDYDELSQVLANVDSEGMVDYSNLSANRRTLDKFVERLGQLSPERYTRWQREEKIAFWINAYNALTLLAIVDNYPIKSSFLTSIIYPKNSIRQISGVWDNLQFEVIGKQLTLDEIEHEILRKEFDEPRIHVALVCAAKSCPPLRQEPFVGGKLNEQLDDQTRRLLADQSKFRIDRTSNSVSLSKIFEWFGNDFENRYGTDRLFQGHSSPNRAVLNFLRDYLPLADRTYLENTDFRLRFLDYDWSLNERGS